MKREREDTWKQGGGEKGQRKRQRVWDWSGRLHPIKLLALPWPIMAFTIAAMPKRAKLIM